jgi:hypothetical protein
MGVLRLILNISTARRKTTGQAICVPYAPIVSRRLKKRRTRKASLAAFLVS